MARQCARIVQACDFAREEGGSLGEWGSHGGGGVAGGAGYRGGAGGGVV